MRESVLAAYFFDDLDVSVLRAEAASIVGRRELVTGQTMLLDLTSDRQVRPAHLVKLCDEVLVGSLNGSELEAIAFFLIASDHFCWDTDTPDGEVVAEVLFDWSAPRINLPLTGVNVGRYRARLMSGTVSIR